MPNSFDIVLRRLSGGQWLGILMIEGQEKYRTGEYKSSAVAALTAVQFWMQNMI